ncbi:MAG: hypothetical protein QOF21_1745 [Actinomycetota bacterium]|jgi:hypothetical protein
MLGQVGSAVSWFAMQSRVLIRWLVAALFGLIVAWQTKGGPILFEVSARHGVHANDFAGFAVGAAWAFLGDPRRSARRQPK